ncbi:hypothetical protein BGW37DRAFT_473551 [Umbelopsis sp. PMI_123]|nr:hypothetical protein BGW37DRAFT_473551 [Umbelopsis sp. PMI_123]
MGKSAQSEMANPLVDRTEGIHALTRAEEENCFKELKKNALKKCEVPIKEFVDCSKEHNVTVAWTCRDKNKAMNRCLNQHTAQEELDKLKLAKLASKRAMQQ